MLREKEVKNLVLFAVKKIAVLLKTLLENMKYFSHESIKILQS